MLLLEQQPVVGTQALGIHALWTWRLVIDFSCGDLKECLMLAWYL